MSNPSAFSDPIVVETIVACISQGGTVRQAAKLADVSTRSIQRAVKREPKFAAMIERAKALGVGFLASGGGPVDIEPLLKTKLPQASELPTPKQRAEPPTEPPTEPPDPPPQSPPDLTKTKPPSPPLGPGQAQTRPSSAIAIEAEIVGTKKKPTKHDVHDWEETARERFENRGDPTEANIEAFYWRVMHDPREPLAMRVTATKAMHDFKMARARATRLEELAGLGRPRIDMRDDREPGLTQEKIAALRHKIIGPPPATKSDPSE